MGLFTHFKTFVEVTDPEGKSLGFFAERFSGGRVEYGMAEASPANRPGRWYRATRFRVGEITVEAYLRKDMYDSLLQLWDTFHLDRSKKFTVRRTLYGDTPKGVASGEERVYEIYTGCSFVEPPQAEDTDVTRDTDFVMVTMRIQPEDKVVTTGKASSAASSKVDLQSGITNP